MKQLRKAYISSQVGLGSQPFRNSVIAVVTHIIKGVFMNIYDVTYPYESRR